MMASSAETSNTIASHTSIHQNENNHEVNNEENGSISVGMNQSNLRKTFSVPIRLAT